MIQLLNAITQSNEILWVWLLARCFGFIANNNVLWRTLIFLFYIIENRISQTGARYLDPKENSQSLLARLHPI